MRPILYQKLRVYFQDESRFASIGTTDQRLGSTRFTTDRRASDRIPASVGTRYGLPALEMGHAEGLLSPQLNTKIINTFLPFSQTLAADEHAAMIWDGAGFPALRELQVPDNVTIIQLPPYSPELNPIENLWHYLKSHFCRICAYAITTS